jgi:hypothetical protein
LLLIARRDALDDYTVCGNDIARGAEHEIAHPQRRGEHDLEREPVDRALVVWL